MCKCGRHQGGWETHAQCSISFTWGSSVSTLGWLTWFDVAVVPGNSRFVGVTPGPMFVVIRVPAVASLQVGHHQAPLATTNTHTQTHTIQLLPVSMNQPQRGALKRGDKKKDYFFSIKQLVCLVTFFKGFYSDLRLLNLSQVNIVRQNPTNSAAVEDLSFLGKISGCSHTCSHVCP